MADRLIPVSGPALVGNEKKYVLDCLESGWISSVGKYVELFEDSFKVFCGARHAIACANGTAALHVALVALGVQPGDDVLVPTLSFVATANAVRYCGARPVFVDSDPATWNIDPAALEARLTARTKGIVVVHLYGHPADMDAVTTVARRHGLFVVEDAAEAHGATYKGKHVGSLADAGTFSFYGNKIVTAGEGGMIVTNDDARAATMRQLKGQGMDPGRRYWFPVIGYNYRMTNIAAAIGFAQIEHVHWHLERRHEIAGWYREALSGAPGISFQGEREWAGHAHWMITILVEEGVDRDQVMARLLADGIETRPAFFPIHTLPPYRDTLGGTFPVAEDIGRRGISLPTWAGLTPADVRYIAECLARAMSEAREDDE